MKKVHPSGFLHSHPGYEMAQEMEGKHIVVDKKDWEILTKNDPKEIGEISDGYHTFNELYDHRITLFIALCNLMYPNARANNMPWKSKLHDDGSMFDGWFIAGIGTDPGVMITYHLPLDRWDELRIVSFDKAPKWDGHTPADVINRIKENLY